MDILALKVTVCGPMGVVGSGQYGWGAIKLKLGAQYREVFTTIIVEESGGNPLFYSTNFLYNVPVFCVLNSC